MDKGSEAVQRQLTHYLTHQDQSAINEAFKDWPSKFAFYAGGWDQEMLQGDSWSGIPIRSFESGEKKNVRALILSNSCAIDPANKRDFPANVLIAPLVPLASMRRLFQESVDANLVEKKISAIVSQKVNSLFFLPQGAGLEQDFVIKLDDVHSIPARHAVPELGGTGKKLATLSQVAFYLFLFKLSIFFCRFQENVDRDFTSSGAEISRI